MKKLYRSQTNKIMAGVMGGIGEYADIDPVVIRACFIGLTIFSAVFPGVLVYLLLVLIIPKSGVVQAKAHVVEEETHNTNENKA